MSHFAGTGALLRLAVRRDRIVATIWIVGLALLALSQGGSMVAFYPTQADLDQLNASAQGAGANPAFLAFNGPAFDASTYGGATAWQLVTFQAAVIGLMSIFLVVRHTRAEEETGRAELVSATVVGRHAWLAASLLFVLGVNVVLAALTAGLFVALDFPLAGSVGIAAACASVGVVFAAVAAITAQMTEHARTASGLASAVLGVVFLLRAVGDATAGGEGADLAWLSWLSPIGWAQQVRAYAGDRWWVLLIPLALTLALLVVVRVLIAHRDVGAGMLPQRLGPAEASPGLRSPLALAWRLQRGFLRGWLIGLGVFGAAMGFLAADTVEFAEQDPTTAEALAALGGSGSLMDIYLAAIFSLFGIVVAGYAVAATLRLRSEETAVRAEPVLATAVSRARWAASHVLWAAVGSVLILGVAGLLGGLAHGLRIGDLGEVQRVLGAALVQVPAVWVLAAFGVALFGLLPRLVALAWGAFALALVVGQFGEALRLDQWVRDLSPFTHLPRLPVAEFTVTPLLWLAALTLALITLGLAGFRRRDVG